VDTGDTDDEGGPVGTRAAGGSFDEAFPALFRRARGLALRILGDLTLAEDAAAEAMARTLVHWDRIGGQTYRDGWVLRVTANVALDMARRRSRDPARRTSPVRADAAAHDEVIVLRAALVSALRALPRRQREAIVLVHLVGLTPTEAAAAMDVSVSSVSQHTRRGLARLRTQTPDLTARPFDLGEAIP